MLHEDTSLKISDDIEVIYNFYKHSSKKPTLIFIHGLGGDLSTWTSERNYFHKIGYSTLALDLPGHGLSSRPKDENAYSMSSLSEAVIAVLDKEKLSSPVLIGHCFGGSVALSIASFQNISLSALVLIDIGYRKDVNRNLMTSKRFIKVVLQALSHATSPSHVEGRRNFAKYIGTGDIDIPRIFADIQHTSMYSWLQCSAHMIGTDLESLLEKISIPSLIVSGSEDTIFPTSTSSTLAQRIKHSHLTIIPGANHILVINNPMSVAQEIETFLAHHNL